MEPPAPDPAVSSRRLLLRGLAVCGWLLFPIAAGACGPSAPPQAASPDSTSPASVTIPEIQGASHVSPLLGQAVVTSGVVTAAADDVFYLQDPDGDGRPETSDALLVAGDAPEPGHRIRVEGTVEEHVPGGRETGNLSVTRVRAEDLEVLAEDEPLPDPVALGDDGRLPPEVSVISEDELPVDLREPDQAASAPFEPQEEGLDFYESLEGMRVTVRAPVAVSPTERFGPDAAELFTLAERGAHVTPDGARTHRGGILLRTDEDNRGDHNPERIQIRSASELSPEPLPTAPVGAELGDVVGVMGYAFGGYGVVATEPVEAAPPGWEPETTELRGDAGHVTVATYNVLNLNPLRETAERMDRLARHIARRLRAPDVLALQEIQDQNGTRGGEGNRETDATATLQALADAVVRAGGPRYEFADVAPAPNSSGGVPGGNIRNAFLYRPDRVELTDLVSVSPEVLERAGARDPRAFQGSRDPLAGTFSFAGRRFVVVNNHFTSRYGSSPVFGAVHPFVQAGEEAREAQSRAIHDYVSRLRTEDPGVEVVVVGDLNTFEFTDDLSRILPGEGLLESLVRRVPAARRYSYNYRGNSQALDHVFVTPGLVGGAEAEMVPLNADLPAADAASDHDPVVVRLSLPDSSSGSAASGVVSVSTRNGRPAAITARPSRAPSPAWRTLE